MIVIRTATNRLYPAKINLRNCIPFLPYLRVSSDESEITSVLRGNVMEVPVRSHFATGVALLGAGVIAVSPVVPKPNVELAAPHISASVDLAALENPIAVIAQLVQQSIANTIAIGGQVLSDPAPILQQILTNQIGNATSLAGSLQQFIANSLTGITVGV